MSFIQRCSLFRGNISGTKQLFYYTECLMVDKNILLMKQKDYMNFITVKVKEEGKSKERFPDRYVCKLSHFSAMLTPLCYGCNFFLPLCSLTLPPSLLYTLLPPSLPLVPLAQTPEVDEGDVWTSECQLVEGRPGEDISQG